MTGQRHHRDRVTTPPEGGRRPRPFVFADDELLRMAVWVREHEFLLDRPVAVPMADGVKRRRRA